MALAINLLFETGDEAALRRWWLLCDAAGVPSVGSTSLNQSPHITLGVVDSHDVIGLIEVLRRTLEHYSAPPLLLTHIGLFVRPATVLYLGVSMTDELIDLHQEVNRIVHEHGDHMWEHYRPAIYTPHVTLARDFEFEALHRLLPDRVEDLPELPVKLHIAGVSIASIPDGDEQGHFGLG